MSTEYTPPVSQLLELGEDPARQSPWPDYLALGLTPEHVPELLRMLGDPAVQEYDESPRGFWPTIHAWRALGQLRAEEAIDPVVEMLAHPPEDDDWRLGDLPRVLGMIGPAAFEPARRLAKRKDVDEYVRTSALSVFTHAATHWPDARDAAIEILTAFLRDYENQDDEFNAFVVAALIDSRATEAAPLIEEAYEADAVDPGVNGDWEEVQVLLGLLPGRTTPRPRFAPGLLKTASASPSPVPQKRGGAKGKTKNRRKDARAARKRNRRK